GVVDEVTVDLGRRLAAADDRDRPGFEQGLAVVEVVGGVDERTDTGRAGSSGSSGRSVGAGRARGTVTGIGLSPKPLQGRWQHRVRADAEAEMTCAVGPGIHDRTGDTGDL